MGSKICTKCGKRKLLRAFHRDSQQRDGRRPRCKKCVKVYDDTLREERNRLAREKYRLDPGSKIRASRQYHLDHPEWSRERLRAHHVANRVGRYQRYLALGQDPVTAARRREATRRSESRRRALKARPNADVISREQFEERLAEFDGCCYICSAPLGADLHWDHFQPLAHDGEHTLKNLFPACNFCNVRKNACWPFTAERREEIKQASLARRGQASRPGRR